MDRKKKAVLLSWGSTILYIISIASFFDSIFLLCVGKRVLSALAFLFFVFSFLLAMCLESLAYFEKELAEKQ